LRWNHRFDAIGDRCVETAPKTRDIEVKSQLIAQGKFTDICGQQARRQ
jgi:hypothetical protein